MKRLILIPKDPKAILQQIVDNEGSCSWANSRICNACPLSRLTKKENGEFASCVESLKASDMSEDEADQLYKKAAESVIADISIDDLISKNKN